MTAEIRMEGREEGDGRGDREGLPPLEQRSSYAPGLYYSIVIPLFFILSYMSKQFKQTRDLLMHTPRQSSKTGCDEIPHRTDE